VFQGCLRRAKRGRCVRLTTLLPRCADCLEIWEPQRPGALRACLDLYRESEKGINFLVLFAYTPLCGKQLTRGYDLRSEFMT